MWEQCEKVSQIYENTGAASSQTREIGQSETNTDAQSAQNSKIPQARLSPLGRLTRICRRWLGNLCRDTCWLWWITILTRLKILFTDLIRTCGICCFHRLGAGVCFTLTNLSCLIWGCARVLIDLTDCSHILTMCSHILTMTFWHIYSCSSY